LRHSVVNVLQCKAEYLLNRRTVEHNSVMLRHSPLYSTKLYVCNTPVVLDGFDVSWWWLRVDLLDSAAAGCDVGGGCGGVWDERWWRTYDRLQPALICC